MVKGRAIECARGFRGAIAGFAKGRTELGAWLCSLPFVAVPSCEPESQSSGVPESTCELVSVVALADVDGDGIRDFAVGRPATSAGRDASGDLMIVSGRTLSIIRTIAAPLGAHTFGFSTLSVDGSSQSADLFIGSPAYTGSCSFKAHKSARGRVYRYSFVRDTLELFAETNAIGDAFGHALSMRIGTKDSDAAIVVGAPGGRGALKKGVDEGRCMLFGVKDGKRIAEWRGKGYDNEQGDRMSDLFGTAVLGLPDLTGDGIGEVAVGAPRRQSKADGQAVGATAVFDGARGAVVFETLGKMREEALGQSLSLYISSTVAAGSPCLAVASWHKGVQIIDLEKKESIATAGSRDGVGYFDGFGYLLTTIRFERDDADPYLCAMGFDDDGCQLGSGERAYARVFNRDCENLDFDIDLGCWGGLVVQHDDVDGDGNRDILVATFGNAGSLGVLSGKSHKYVVGPTKPGRD